jgi:hypothetical protein
VSSRDVERRPRAPQGSGDQLRAEIIGAATALLVGSGNPEHVTLRAVARKVGIAAPSNYLHFAIARSCCSPCSPMPSSASRRLCAEVTPAMRSTRRAMPQHRCCVRPVRRTAEGRVSDPLQRSAARLGAHGQGADRRGHAEIVRSAVPRMRGSVRRQSIATLAHGTVAAGMERAPWFRDAQGQRAGVPVDQRRALPRHGDGPAPAAVRTASVNSSFAGRVRCTPPVGRSARRHRPPRRHLGPRKCIHARQHCGIAPHRQCIGARRRSSGRPITIGDVSDHRLGMEMPPKPGASPAQKYPSTSLIRSASAKCAPAQPVLA